MNFISKIFPWLRFAAAFMEPLTYAHEQALCR